MSIQQGVKKILKEFETTMAAAAFAEAGDFTSAREMMLEGKEERQKDNMVKPEHKKEEKKDGKKQS